MNSSEVIATFDSTHYALRFEKVLKQNEIGLIVMPVPREISASCGLAVKFSQQDFLRVKELAQENEIQVKRFYEIQMENNKKEYFAIE
jgi:hypothetical protein